MWHIQWHIQVEDNYAFSSIQKVLIELIYGNHDNSWTLKYFDDYMFTVNMKNIGKRVLSNLVIYLESGYYM